MLGATGTIGRATVRALVERGHDVVCLVRPRAGVGGALTPDDSIRLLDGAAIRFGDVTDPASLARDGVRDERFDVLVSCLASRTGAAKAAWAIHVEPRFRRVPVALLDAIIWGLGTLGHLLPPLAEKCELARIGRYYATESMLVIDPATGSYSADATPSTGTETLFDFYARLIQGKTTVERGDHAVF